MNKDAAISAEACGAGHYARGYLTHERWVSYVHQLSAVRDLAPESIIEAGIGPGVKKHMVAAAFSGCRYVGVDIDAELGPDVCADVRRLPFADRAADVTFCCQVLEHLAYSGFCDAVLELKRVTRKRLVLSLPDVSPFFYARVRVPGFRHVFPWLWNGISVPSPLPRAHSLDGQGQHHWEIGKRGYSLRRIVGDLRTIGWSRIRHFRMVERWYWHFFLLDV